MSDLGKGWDNPKNILTFLEIGVLLATVVFVFAFMRAEVDRHEVQIKDHEVQIKENRQRLNQNDVEKAVTNEQYRQIMEKLEELSKKMDER